MSSTIIPTFYHNRKTSEDIPVWKITTPSNREFFCERLRTTTLTPLKVIGPSSFTKESGLVVCGAKIPLVRNKPASYIISSKDGFSAPSFWYGDSNQKVLNLNPPPPSPPKNPLEDNEENFPSLSASLTKSRRR